MEKKEQKNRSLPHYFRIAVAVGYFIIGFIFLSFSKASSELFFGEGRAHYALFFGVGCFIYGAFRFYRAQKRWDTPDHES